MIYTVKIFFDIYEGLYVFENIDKLVLYFQEVSSKEESKFKFHKHLGVPHAIVAGCSQYIIFGLSEEEYNLLSKI